MRRRMLVAGALVGLWGVTAVQAAVLDISIDAQGAAYNNLVADAKLRGDSGLADVNLGAGSGGSNRIYANFLLDGATQTTRGMTTFVQRFDVSSIPAGSTINSATLTQYFANQTANNRTFVDMKLSQLRPGKGWVEGVSPPPENPTNDGSVTWNNQASHANPPPSVPWGVPGARDASDIFLGSTQTFDLVGVDGSPTQVDRNITAFVQDWVNNPSNNTGLLWWGGNSADSDSGNRYFHFGTKEDGPGPASDAAAAAPRLLIDYTPIPEPGTTALLAAASLSLLARRRKRS